VNETVPAKWLIDDSDRVMLEGPFTSTGPNDVALRPKSPNMKTAVVEWTSVVLLLAIVNV